MHDGHLQAFNSGKLKKVTPLNSLKHSLSGEAVTRVGGTLRRVRQCGSALRKKLLVNSVLFFADRVRTTGRPPLKIHKQQVCTLYKKRQNRLTPLPLQRNR